MPNSGRRLLDEIESTHSAAPTVWWLGHCGFAIKYYDILFYIDPRLAAGAVLDAAAIATADLILCTHAGAGHMHAPTLTAMLTASRHAKVVLPKSTAEHARQKGIDLHRMTTTDSGLRIEYFKTGTYARIYAVPSAHPGLDWTPLGGYPYLGYLVRCGDTTIYHAGDCIPYDGLADRLRPYNVKLALLPIGADGFTPEQAAHLATDIGARWLAPMHYEPGDTMMQGFLDHMLFHQPSQRFKIFEPGEGWQIPEQDLE